MSTRYFGKEIQAWTYRYQTCRKRSGRKKELEICFGFCFKLLNYKLLRVSDGDWPKVLEKTLEK